MPACVRHATEQTTGKGMAGGPRQGILSLTIKDKNALYAAYMQFVKNGGLFIPTTKQYKLGDEVFMLLTLMDEAERLPVAGKIIWITPVGAEGNRAAGIGRFKASPAVPASKRPLGKPSRPLFVGSGPSACWSIEVART
jgi:type IV pilus assembly protein PilZ